MADCVLAGINASEGTWRGHLIGRCEVFDTVLETRDHDSPQLLGPRPILTDRP